MDCETEAAFEGADVVLEEVGIFVEIDGFEGEFAETLASVRVGGGLRCYSSAAEFGAGSVLDEEDVRFRLVDKYCVTVVRWVPGNPW